ncbi:hypothetical protein Dimus_007641 [Dionaea muscipula]
MRSRRLGDLCDLDPEIERTLCSIRAKRRLELNTQNQKEMDDPPPANHVPAANGAANQRPLREYAAPQWGGERVAAKKPAGMYEVDGITMLNAKVDALITLFSKLGNVNAVTTPPVSAVPCNFCGGPHDSTECCQLEEAQFVNYNK